MQEMKRGLMRGFRRIGPSVLVLGLAGLGFPGQAQAQTQQPLPDAPSAKRTPQQLPAQPPINTAPLPPSEQTPASGDNPTPPAHPDEKAVKPSSDAPDRPKVSPDDNPFPGPATPEDAPEAAAPTVPPPAANQPPPPQSAKQQELGTIRKVVNFVAVPVTVKDDSGRLVSGLLPKDFQLLEGGEKQELRYFTSDPFALSAAIVFDQGLPDVAVQKINQTFEALEGAFSPYDEVAIYTYSSATRKLKDFGAFGKGTSQVFSLLKSETGRTGGPQVYSGPLGPQGPSVNGLPVGGGPNLIHLAPQESHALNDALLRAAVDLGKRPRERRKVIFIISDGRESGSQAAYADVLRVLLTNDISVYAVAVDDAALPVLRKLKEIKLPKKGYGNILPKYTSATGGEDFPEFSQSAIEEAYNRAMGDARNQYTLGYYSHAQPGVYRQLEVKVARAGLRVHAKDGFYPLPPARRAQP
jgi:VWFA-related protein